MWVQEVIERWGQPVVCHFVNVEVQPVEEHLVELPPHWVAGLPVELLWVVEQVERCLDQRRARFQQRALRRQFMLYARTFLSNGQQPGSHLRGDGAARFQQVEQVVLFGVKLFQCLSEVVMHQAQAALLVGQRRCQHFADSFGKAFRQPQGDVVPQDSGLGIFNADAGRVT